MRFAKGGSAYFMCGRCGTRGRYTESVSDGQYPGLRVHPNCRDEKHPAEKPFKADDAIALQHPSPDTDDDSGGSTGTTLAEALGFTNYFGGNT